MKRWKWAGKEAGVKGGTGRGVVREVNAKTEMRRTTPKEVSSALGRFFLGEGVGIEKKAKTGGGKTEE